MNRSRITLTIARAALIAALPLPLLVAPSPDIGAPPGRLLDVGGRKLHLIASGTGSPTVVLEAGASSFAIVSMPESKPWDLHEFTVADVDGALFRVFYLCDSRAQNNA